MGIRLEIDHIIPLKANGTNEEENLCLACSSCNRAKSDQSLASDPLSKALIPLFNPNKQDWFEHFRWTDDGTKIIGITPCGRATVAALKLNNRYMVVAREFWVRAKEHPPHE